MHPSFWYCIMVCFTHLIGAALKPGEPGRASREEAFYELFSSDAWRFLMFASVATIVFRAYTVSVTLTSSPICLRLIL